MSNKIKDLYDGYREELTALTISMNRGVTTKGAPYLSFMFRDRSGSINAKYQNISEKSLHEFQPDMLVEMSGNVLYHQKQLRFRVQQIEELEKIANISDYVKEGPYSQQALHETIQLYIGEIENTIMKQLVCEILKDHEKNFFEHPAATRSHHDFYAGLATHVLGTLQLAGRLCHLYPMLDRDLLYSGVTLRDVGETIELSGAIVGEYATQGKPLGHIFIMQVEILVKTEQLGLEDREEATLPRHMILSHHGIYEYGSPVLLMIPEAEMLHMIDNIDAHMNTLHRTLEPVQVGEFIQRVFVSESRSFYKSRHKSSDGK